MRKMIKILGNVIVLSALLFNSSIGISVNADMPAELRFAHARSRDFPVTQWLILIYTEALQRMNVKFTFVDVPSKRASVYADLGKIDGELNRVYDYNTMHPDLVRVEEHNRVLTFSAFATDSSIVLDGWSSLKNTSYNVEYRRGTKKCAEVLRQMKKEGLLEKFREQVGLTEDEIKW